MIAAILTAVVAGISAVVGIGTGIAGGVIKSKEQKAQAEQLRRNAEEVKKMALNEEISLQEALQRIDTMIANTKGELKSVLESNVNQAANRIRQQYSTLLETTQKNLRTSFAQRRLAGSSAFAEAIGKTTETVGRESAQRIEDLRERAMNLLAGQISSLTLSGEQAKERRVAGSETFQNTALVELLQISNFADTLDKEAKLAPVTGLLQGLSSAAPALGQLAGAFFTPTTGTQGLSSSITGLPITEPFKLGKLSAPIS